MSESFTHLSTGLAMALASTLLALFVLRRNSLYAAGYGIFFALGLSVFWTGVHFPAVMSVDSFMVYREAMSGSFTGQHPPIIGLSTRVLYLLFGFRPEIPAFLQSLVLFSSAFFCFYLLFYRKLFLFVISTVLLAAWAPMWVYPSTLWKDVFFAIQLCLSGAFFLLYFEGILVKSHKRLNLVLAFAFLGFALSSRHNALVLMGPFFLFWLATFVFPRFLFVPKNHKWIVGLAFVGAAITPKLFNTVVAATPGDFRSVVFLANFAGWTTHHHRLAKEPEEKTEAFWDSALNNEKGLEQLVARDVPAGEEWTYMMDPKLDRSQQSSALEELDGGLLALMGHFFLEETHTVLHYVWTTFNRLIYKKNDHPYWYHLRVEPNKHGIEFRSCCEKFHTQLAYFYLPDSYRLYARKHWIFLVALSVILLVGIFFKVLPRWLTFFFEDVPRSAMFVMPIFGLGYTSSFLIVTAVADWRYLFPVSLMGFILVAPIVLGSLYRIGEKCLHLLKSARS